MEGPGGGGANKVATIKANCVSFRLKVSSGGAEHVLHPCFGSLRLLAGSMSKSLLNLKSTCVQADGNSAVSQQRRRASDGKRKHYILGGQQGSDSSLTP